MVLSLEIEYPPSQIKLIQNNDISVLPGLRLSVKIVYVRKGQRSCNWLVRLLLISTNSGSG